MRRFWSVVVACFVGGCAKSTTNNAPPPTPIPITTASVPAGSGEAPPVVPETKAATTEPAREVAPDGPPLASCSLKATLRDAGPKASGPRFSLTLTNQGAKPLRLVVPGDGSGEGWRTPVLTWSAKDASGTDASRLNQGRCGFMNRIDASEIFTLAPGATRDLGAWISPPPFGPGTYEVRLTYRNDPRLAARKDSEPDDVKQLILASSACEITSNAIRTKLD